jgi:hypothetical protein
MYNSAQKKVADHPNITLEKLETMENSKRLTGKTVNLFQPDMRLSA